MKRHRSTEPYSALLPSALRYPLSSNGLITLAALGLFVAIFSLACAGALLARFVVITYLLAQIIRTARGSKEIEIPDFTELFGDLILPAFRASLAVAPLNLLLALHILHLVQGHDASILETPWKDPVLWLLGIAFVLYFPIAFIAAAIPATLLQLINPFALVAYATRLGRDYLVAAGMLLGVGVFDLALFEPMARLIERIPLPILPTIFSTMVVLYPRFVAARVLGLLMWRRGDAVGYGPASDYLVPVLGDAEPRGQQLQKSEVEEPRRPRPDSIDLAPTAEDLARAVADNQIERAVEMFRQLDDEESSRAAAAALLAVGQGASGRQDFPLAVRALKAAARTGDAQVAPRALVILGRVYGERLGDVASADAVFREVVARYPGTQAGSFAAARLARNS